MQYHWVILVFGVFLIVTGLKMMFAPDKEVEPEKNLLLRLFRRLVPVTDEARRATLLRAQEGRA